MYKCNRMSGHDPDLFEHLKCLNILNYHLIAPNKNVLPIILNMTCIKYHTNGNKHNSFKCVHQHISLTMTHNLQFI